VIQARQRMGNTGGKTSAVGTQVVRSRDRNE